MDERVSPHWRTVIERLACAVRNAAPGEAHCAKDGACSVPAETSDLEQALNALVRQVTFSDKEKTVAATETDDPLAAGRYVVRPLHRRTAPVGTRVQTPARIVHQYKNRCLFLTTGACFARCRYCFRRKSPALDYSFATQTETAELAAYLQMHGEIREVLLSGGDPLTASDAQLETLLSAVREKRPDVLIRLCTRAPVFAPERFTACTVSLLKRFKPLWLIPHINHAAEFSPRFSPEAYAALAALVENGIPMQSQTVLLRGVNDSVEVLADLFHKLTLLGVKPGYLFQGDLAPGTSHMRVGIEKGIALYEKLRTELSGLSLPVYAVDIPGGGGKFNLLQLNPALFETSVRRAENSYVFTVKGVQYEYPVEP